MPSLNKSLLDYNSALLQALEKARKACFKWGPELLSEIVLPTLANKEWTFIL